MIWFEKWRDLPRRGLKFVFDNSLFLVVGTVVALAWANLWPQSYHGLTEWSLLNTTWIGSPQDGGLYQIDLHFIVNDMLMALFFAIAGKEVWDAMQPGQPLHKPQHAAVPMIAALGGMTMPAVIYLAGAALLGRFGELHRGWAIPTATDVAFSYMIGLLIFGRGHPALSFLLLLAIADDAGGLIILAVAYPQQSLHLAWLGLVAAALVVGLAFQQLRVRNFWWYLLIPGIMSWLGFQRSGLHPALGLLPIIPFLPLWPFQNGRGHLEEAIHEFERWWRKPVELILGTFGLVNAGVTLGASNEVSLLVLTGLVVGKPLGIWGAMQGLVRFTKFTLPEGLTLRDIAALGCAAGVGLTVSLFITTVAFKAGAVQDAAKMGALLSFLAAIVAIVAAKLLGVKRRSGR